MLFERPHSHVHSLSIKKQLEIYLRKLASRKHNDPNNSEIRNAYQNALKDSKNNLEVKKNKFQNEKIEELENHQRPLRYCGNCSKIALMISVKMKMLKHLLRVGG